MGTTKSSPTWKSASPAGIRARHRAPLDQHGIFRGGLIGEVEADGGAAPTRACRWAACGRSGPDRCRHRRARPSQKVRPREFHQVSKTGNGYRDRRCRPRCLGPCRENRRPDSFPGYGRSGCGRSRHWRGARRAGCRTNLDGLDPAGCGDFQRQHEIPILVGA